MTSEWRKLEQKVEAALGKKDVPFVAQETRTYQNGELTTRADVHAAVGNHTVVIDAKVCI